MLENLLEAMKEIPDHRRPNTVHPLHSILTMSVCAILCGSTSLLAISQWGRDHGGELANALGFRRSRMPCVASWHYVFRSLDVAAFERRLGIWLLEQMAAMKTQEGDKPTPRKAIALDGKVLRGTDGHAEVPGVGLVAAFVHGAGIVLDEEKILGRDELQAVRALVERVATPDNRVSRPRGDSKIDGHCRGNHGLAWCCTSRLA